MRLSVRFSSFAGAFAAAAVVLGSGGPAHGAVVVAGDVTAPGDRIYGVGATPPGGTSTVSAVGITPDANSHPAGEAPEFAIDNVLSNKYLNFAKTNAGFIVTLLNNGPQATLNGVRFGTGNDAPERDPLQVVIEGTNTPIASGLAAGSTIEATWLPIYSGTSGLAADPGRNVFGPLQAFVPTTAGAFSSYRVTVTGVRDAGANSFQFSEVELIGNTVVPEPAAASLLTLGAGGLLARRRQVRQPA